MPATLPAREGSRKGEGHWRRGNSGGCEPAADEGGVLRGGPEGDHEGDDRRQQQHADADVPGGVQDEAPQGQPPALEAGQGLL